MSTMMISIASSAIKNAIDYADIPRTPLVQSSGLSRLRAELAVFLIIFETFRQRVR